jgi:hypothetical protein
MIVYMPQIMNLDNGTLFYTHHIMTKRRCISFFLFLLIIASKIWSYCPYYSHACLLLLPIKFNGLIVKLKWKYLCLWNHWSCIYFLRNKLFLWTHDAMRQYNFINVYIICQIMNLGIGTLFYTHHIMTKRRCISFFLFLWYW